MAFTQAAIERFRPQRLHRAIGMAMIALGLVMLLSVAAYYAYSRYSRANFDDLSFEITTTDASVETSPVNGTAQGASFTVVQASSQDSIEFAAEPAINAVVVPKPTPDGTTESADATSETALSAEITETTDALSESAEPEAATSGSVGLAPDSTGGSEAAPDSSDDAALVAESTDATEETVDVLASAASYNGPFLMDSFAMSYPGIDVHPKYWDDPLWAGSDRMEAYLLPDGFAAVSYKSDDYEWFGEAPANRMVIADIGVDATVNGLRIIDLGDSQAYETPKNIVGHIPSTANPGEYSNGWYFGHLQSPIRGEGNVFRSLPKLSQLIRDGDPIFVTLYSADGEYVYQVVKGEVVHPSELELTDTSDAEITLVTCYPPLVYDHRYVVTAKLVGVKN